MTVKELILACSGKDASGFPKCGVGLFYEKWKEDGTSQTIDEVSTDNPVVEIFQSDSYTQVDLKYSSTVSVDLRMMWDLLQRYASPENSYDDSEDEFPAIVLSIIPKEFGGNYYFLGTQPVMFALQPDTVKGESTVIRIIFDNQNFAAYDATEVVSEEEEE